MKLDSFIYKETLHVLRDKRMLVVALAIPIVQMLLFGFAISIEVNNVNVAVAYERYDEDIRATISRLKANKDITLVEIVSPEDVNSILRKGEADAVVFFRNSQKIQIITDSSNPVISQSVNAYLRAIISDRQFSSTLVETTLLYNLQMKSSYNFVPGIMGMLFMLVCALMTVVSIVRERETGTMQLLLVSPVTPLRIIISKMAPFFFLSLIDLALILLIANLLLGIPMQSGIWSVVLLSVIYILLSLSLGLFVSTIARSQVMAMLICGMVMIMPVVFLSGMIFPVDNLPIILKQLSFIVPARWYIDAMRKIMVEGLDLSFVSKNLVILLLMTVSLFMVAIRKFKIRL